MSDKIVRTDAEWRSELTPEQYAVCRQKATEHAFTGKYHDSSDEGVYTCVCCGNPLFRSDTKFHSGSGWPSFWAPIEPQALHTEADLSHGMTRVEVQCARCDAHLGHLFEDGPEPTGLRFCMNSIALELKKS